MKKRISHFLTSLTILFVIAMFIGIAINLNLFVIIGLVSAVLPIGLLIVIFRPVKMVKWVYKIIYNKIENKQEEVIKKVKEEL